MTEFRTLENLEQMPRQPMQPKLIWQSKTFWLNALTAAAGILVVVVGSDVVKDHPQLVGYLAIAQGVINVFLRMITSEPVKLS